MPEITQPFSGQDFEVNIVSHLVFFDFDTNRKEGWFYTNRKKNSLNFCRLNLTITQVTIL